MKLTSLIVSALSLLVAVDAAQKKCHKAGESCVNIGNRACQCNSGDLVRSFPFSRPAAVGLTNEISVIGTDPVRLAHRRQLLHQGQDVPGCGQEAAVRERVLLQRESG